MNVTFCRLALLCLRFRSPVPLIKSASYNLRRRDGPDNDIGSPTALLSLRELNDLRRTHCCLTSFRVDSRAKTFALSATAPDATRAVGGVYHSLFMALTSKEIRKCAMDGLGPSVMIRRANTSLSLLATSQWGTRAAYASETEAATVREAINPFTASLSLFDIFAGQ